MFVDYGNTECQERDGLKKVHPKLMNLPAQAIFCGLSGILSSYLYKVAIYLIGGVMVSVLATGAVNHGFEP